MILGVMGLLHIDRCISAEVSLIAVSCETPTCLVYIRNTCSILYFIQFVSIAIFMSLHGPAGAYVLKHCGAHKHNNNNYKYTHTRDPEQTISQGKYLNFTNLVN